MKRSVLLDTGPLLALIDARDRYHDCVRVEFADIVPPLLTCEAVLTEACFLAQREFGSVDALLGVFKTGVVRLAFSLEPNWSEVAALLRQYVDVPMSLADACLVRMSELVPDCTVLTLDSDFRVYRRNRRQKIPLRMPGGR